MPLAPLRVRSLRRLLFAYGVNQLGDWAGELALAVVVFAATGSAAAVAATWVAHRALLALAAPLLVARIESRVGLRVLPLIYLAQAAAVRRDRRGSAVGPGRRSCRSSPSTGCSPRPREPWRVPPSSRRHARPACCAMPTRS